MNIGWPEGILLTLLFISLAINAVKHGQEKVMETGDRKGLPELHSFPISLVRFMIFMTLLYFGGFFA